MITLATLLFWLSLLIVLYVYFGFPLLTAAIGRIRNREVRQTPITPKLSLIIAAYNEEETIAERIENALACDYPKDRLEILVASDGSTDATESIAGPYAAQGVKLLSLARRGKIHALNAAVSQAGGIILVFSDANTMFEREALRNLARNFADPEVGAVAGNKIYTVALGSESSGRGEKMYWSYDKRLKQLETLTGSCVSADGAIYAIRRRLYHPLTDSGVTDDFAISTAVVEQGYRLIFEREARAYEAVIPTANREFSRKVRLMTRGLRALLLRRRLLNPFRFGFYSVELFSHKLLRRMVPLFLLTLLAGSFVAANAGGFYLTVAGAQMLFYGCALVGFALRESAWGGLRFLVIPFFYCLANLAALLALIKLIRGERIEKWQPQRHGAAAGTVGKQS